MTKEKSFRVEEFFPKKLFERVAELRVECCGVDLPGTIARRRKAREDLTKDGRLTILAADHPARMVVSALGNPTLLGNRYEFLGRILRVLTLPGWDGVMGTTDVLEELLMLDDIIKENGGKSFLDGKVMIGCMNRGGLKGVKFEMDDRFTSFTAKRLAEMDLDGAKLMFRITSDGEEACAKTIDYCAKAIQELNKRGISIFLECLAVENKEKGYRVIKEAEDLIKVISVATALGDSSRNIWLKVPYCKDFEKVALATTCPILILGGEAKDDPTPLLKDFIAGMKAGKNVRGTLVGRNILFPGQDDPRAIAAAVNSIVHKGYNLKQALDEIKKERGKEMLMLKEVMRRKK